MTQTRNRPAGNGAAPQLVRQTTTGPTVPARADNRPGWTAERVAYALALAFRSGQEYERTRVYAELEALDTTWRTAPRPSWDEQVAARIASMKPRDPVPPLRFDDPHWPPVAVPGCPGLRLGPGQTLVDGVPVDHRHDVESAP